jgi:hypothetical protein
MAVPPIPPNSGRFQKGQSGNLKGRPRKVKVRDISAFDVVINKKLIVTQNGVPRELTAEEALQHRTYQDAIAGSRMAQREVLKMIAKRDKARAATADGPPLELTYRTEPMDPDNADAALQILGIASRNEDVSDWNNDREWLHLETWAVQAALARRRGALRLDDAEIKDITRCTRDAAKLRWPRRRER